MNKQTEALKQALVDDEGENQAVRMFLALYGSQAGITTKQMRQHLEMAGFDGAWPEWADKEMHLTKAGAQLWIRHLFALAEQPEFIKHEVENAGDWSEWVCPNPKSYLMKCCDCGLVHEAEFGVVRYKSETEREDCEPVDDPNLEAVFRMRRSEQWSPADTAHRAGGLPMAEQPAQQEQQDWRPTDEDYKKWCDQHDMQDPTSRDAFDDAASIYLTATPPKRQPLTDEQIGDIWYEQDRDFGYAIRFARAIEAAHGIKGQP